LTKIRVAECGTVRTITDVDEEDDRLKAAIDPNAPSETPVRLKLSEQGQTWSIFTSPWDSKDFEKAKLSWGQISSRPEDFGVGVRGEPEESLQIPDGDTFHTIKVSKKGAAYSFACTDGFFEGTLSSLDALIRVIDEKLTAEKPKAKAGRKAKADSEAKPPNGQDEVIDETGDATELLKQEKNEDAVLVLIHACLDGTKGASRADINSLMQSLYPDHKLGTVLAPGFAKNGILWEIEGDRSLATFKLLKDGTAKAKELLARPGMQKSIKAGMQKSIKAAKAEEEEEVKQESDIAPEGTGEYFVCEGTKKTEAADPKGHCIWKRKGEFSTCEAGKLAKPGNTAYDTLDEAKAACTAADLGGVMFVPKFNPKRKPRDSLLERLQAEASESGEMAKLRQDEINKHLNASTTASSAPALGTPEYLPFYTNAYESALEAANKVVADRFPDQDKVDRLIAELQKEEMLYSQFDTLKMAMEAKETVSAQQPGEDFLASLKALNAAKQEASEWLTKRQRIA